MIGHFVWTLQKAENKIKVALDSGKVDQMTEVIGSSKIELKTCCMLTGCNSKRVLVELCLLGLIGVFVFFFFELLKTCKILERMDDDSAGLSVVVVLLLLLLLGFFCWQQKLFNFVELPIT